MSGSMFAVHVYEDSSGRQKNICINIYLPANQPNQAPFFSSFSFHAHAAFEILGGDRIILDLAWDYPTGLFIILESQDQEIGECYVLV